MIPHLKMKATVAALLFILLSLGAMLLHAADAPDWRKLNQDGQTALDRGDYSAAIDIYRTAIRLNPSWLDARMGITEALYLLGEYADANREMALTKKLAPADTQRILLEARILVALGKYDEAITLYNSILTKRPYDGEANQGLGEIYAIQGQRELADDAYAKSLQYKPGNLRALLQLILLHDRAGEQSMAEHVVQEALTRYPDNLNVRIQAAEHYSLYGEWNMASQHLDTAMVLLNGAKDNRYRQLARLQAALALRRGDPAVAESALNSMPGANEQDVLFLKARAYRALGKEVQAQQTLELLIKMDPEDEISHLFRESPFLQTIDGLEEYRHRAAQRYIDMGKKYENSFYYRKAFDSYRIARRIDSMNPDLWLTYANLIRLMGFSQKYRDELNAAIAELDKTPAKKIKFQEKLTLLDHSASGGIDSKWGVEDPWNTETSSWKTAIFFIADKQSLPDHAGAEAALSLYFAELLDSRFEIRVINPDGGIFPGVREVDSFTEALKAARTEADYFILLEFAETSRSFGATATVFLGRTGEELARLSQLRLGENRVQDAMNQLVQGTAIHIPLKMRILKVDGTRVLLDKGRWHGLEPGDKEYTVLRKGSVRPSIVNGGLEYSPGDFLGTLTIQSVSEPLGEGVFSMSGSFNFVSAGDEVFSIAAPENIPETILPDPALRMKLLSVP